MKAFTPCVARKVALDISLGLGLRNAQLRGQPESRNPVDDAEVDRFRPAARLLVHGLGRHAEDLAGGEGVNVFVVLRRRAPAADRR